MIRNSLLTIAFLLVAGFSLLAQTEKPIQSKTEISLEIDPATFVFKGYGVHLRIKPKNSEHLLIGAGAYAMDIPDLLVEMNSKNKNKGWNLRISQAYGVFGEYHFSETNRKWFTGVQIGLQENKITNEFATGEEKFTNLLFMTYGGYTWHVFDTNIYIKPWAGIGFVSSFSGENQLGELEYDIAKMTMFATLHLGYRF